MYTIEGVAYQVKEYFKELQVGYLSIIKELQVQSREKSIRHLRLFTIYFI